jgi:glycerol-3-phosphate acyltransferase PlsY
MSSFKKSVRHGEKMAEKILKKYSGLEPAITTSGVAVAPLVVVFSTVGHFFSIFGLFAGSRMLSAVALSRVLLTWQPDCAKLNYRVLTFVTFQV